MTLSDSVLPRGSVHTLAGPCECAPERTRFGPGLSDASRGSPEVLDDAVGRRGDQQGGGAAEAHARDRRLVVREARNRGPALRLVDAARPQRTQELRQGALTACACSACGEGMRAAQARGPIYLTSLLPTVRKVPV